MKERKKEREKERKKERKKRERKKERKIPANCQVDQLLVYNNKVKRVFFLDLSSSHSIFFKKVSGLNSTRQFCQ